MCCDYRYDSLRILVQLGGMSKVYLFKDDAINSLHNLFISTNIAISTLKDLSQLSMVIDFLPGVSRSIFGDIEVFGKKNPVYYVDNKRVRDHIDLMKISPQQVESIEIETQPEAEFENNVGAIIHIKLKKRVGDGLDGIVGFESDFKRGFKGHIAMSLNYRIGKVIFSWRYNLNTQRRFV